jgi:hypothetical protein
MTILIETPLNRVFTIHLETSHPGRLTMTDYYSTAVAKELVPCSRYAFEELDRSMQAAREMVDEFECESCMEAEYIEGEGVFLFAEDCFGEDDLNDKICAAIGRLLTSVGMEYLEFDFSGISSHLMVGSHGGGSFRIYADGSLVWPTITWSR